ncbi:MAG: hypothetical protein V1901_04135 [Patescibacteria group bacterium]
MIDIDSKVIVKFAYGYNYTESLEGFYLGSFADFIHIQNPINNAEIRINKDKVVFIEESK